MGFFSRLARGAVRLIGGVAGGVLTGGMGGGFGGLLKAGLSLFTKNVEPAQNNVLQGNQSFGLNSLLSGFMGKFMQSPLGLLAGNVLGSLPGLFTGLMNGEGGGMSNFFGLANSGFGAGGIQQNAAPEAIGNLAAIIAQSQAKNLFPSMFSA